MVHGSKVHDPNAHCSPCTAAIPPEYIKWYTDLYNRKRARKDALKKGKDAVHQDLVNTTEEMTATRMAAKANKRRNTSGLSPATSSVSQATSLVRQQSPLTCSTTHSVSSYVIDLFEDDNRKQPAQLTLEAFTRSIPTKRKQSVLLESNEASCDTAIALMIQTCNLPLNFGENQYFLNAMKLGRMTSNKYEPPKRNTAFC